MKRFFYAAIILTTCSATLATPVLFTTVSLTGSVNNRTIEVTSESGVPSVITGGGNPVSTVPMVLQPVNGSVQANLSPGNYSIKVDGWLQSATIVVPNSASVVNAASIISTNGYSPLTIYTGPVTISTPPAGPTYNFSSDDFMVDSDTNVSISTNIARIGDLGPAAFVSTNAFLGTNTLVQETTGASSITVDATGRAIIDVRTNSGVTDQQAAVISSSYTNLGIATANVCYLSQSMGSVTPVPGDPRYPFLTAQSAANACPSNGVVEVVDGNFNEVVIVTNNQTWYFSDNTFLNGFNVANAPGFGVYGLGTIGVPGLFYNSFSNNYSALRIECKNWIGGAYFATTNSATTVTIAARDNLDGWSFNFLDQNTQTLNAQANYITNLQTITSRAILGGVSLTSSNKTYVFRANRQIVCSTANGQISAPTNCYFYFNAPNIVFKSGGLTRGNICFGAPSESYTIEGADLSLASGTCLVHSMLSTNDLYFINCRLNLGSTFYSGATGVGLVKVHYIGCVNVTANPPTTTNVINVVDNTVVDPTWTNALRY